MGVSNQEFRNALATFASGVTVVTASAGNQLYGLTVSAFCSVSLEPPLILVCIENAARCRDAFSKAGKIAINVLSEQQIDISARFATQLKNKFEGIEYGLNGNGTPLLSGTVATLECSICEEVEGGDHTIFVAEVERTTVNGGSPLLYFKGGYNRLVN
ncbi:MAG: flavin reductase [Acidobacteria bacterium]|nr:MAG: flavin reductase [Acidobacteriota bacterium]REJ98687.1 MAG: flavin reductase [Acidobacteriota bacterium]REK16657.1 MAG: flavin reductase [Acidobacteriota bacterium]REK42568.1 MAG: flavin reductase [Acidobacteriota bacterium]